ncbi:MAG: DNA glycosylase AlkZ-like family protein [Ktedonobacteraceae bacterium]
MVSLLISKKTQRQFILGKQGLYPGRRWQGKGGVCEALRAGCVAQIDPLTVVAHNQDIVLYGRVLEYQPADLQALLYTDRLFFDYGGAVMIHPMEELPYWRVVMARKRDEPRRVQFASEHGELIEVVHNAIRDRGPLSARDFAIPDQAHAGLTKGTFRSGKVVNQVLYYLWIVGELMTYKRQGLEYVYDLRERNCPANLNWVASTEEADNFFALKTLQRGGMLSAQEWKQWFAGTIQRSVSTGEARDRLKALLKEGKIMPVTVQEEPGTQLFLLAEDLPLLEQLHSGTLPAAWQPLTMEADDEMIFLAPLDIVSTRGRASPLFHFDYVWEVYKPQEKRRWGYYTLPILYKDTLVARTDFKLERDTHTLVIKGFWLEDHIQVTIPFITALARAFKRFMRFVAAEQVDTTALSPLILREQVEKMLHAM